MPSNDDRADKPDIFTRLASKASKVSDSLCSGLGGPLCSSTTGWDGVHVDDVVVVKPA